MLTPHVYRLADLTNKSDYVLLPGEATMYLGTDFVGQTKLPLVAIGEPFTVGFGVDPQLQVQPQADRQDADHAGRQPGAEVRVPHPAVAATRRSRCTVQVWDRLPHAEAAQTIAVDAGRSRSRS